MSIQKIIQEAINKSPRDLKEALESELRSRISEAIAEKMEEVEELDEAFEEGDKVHFQDEYGQKLQGHITKPFSAKKNGAKHAEVRLVGGMGTKMHVPHGQLKKVNEELDEAIHQEGDRVKWHDHSSGKTLTGTVQHPHGGRMKGGSLAVVKVDGTHMGSTAKIPHKQLSKMNESFELDEAIKPGDRVKIHKPGKDYHGHIGTVGEVRKRTYGTGAPSYTIDYYKPDSDHRHSVTLNRDEFKKHKEQRGLLDAKESFDLSDFSIEELEDFMESAEFDQLDEISKKTLGSYVDKAADRAALHGIGYGEKKAQSDEMDRMMNRHMSYSDKDKVRSIMKTSMKDVEEPREKMVKRLRGISTAAKKLSGGAKVPAGDK